MRVAKFAAAGVGALVAFKLAAPLLAMVLGLLMLALKIGAIVAIGYFVWSWLSKKNEDDGADENEIVVEEDE